MTNDRPSEDGNPDAEGEELVEADLPGAPRSWDGEPAGQAAVEPPRPPDRDSAPPDDGSISTETDGDLEAGGFNQRTAELFGNEEDWRSEREATERARLQRESNPANRDREVGKSEGAIGTGEEAGDFPFELPPPEPLEDPTVRPAIATTVSEGSRTLQALVVGVILAVGGIAGLILVFDPFGGTDDATGAIPGDAVATAAPTTAVTSAPTEVPTAEPTNEAGFTETERTLALMQIAAAADLRGDLWLRAELNTGLSGAPDTVAFLYAFALGAAVQTEDGYNGAYYSVTDGVSYAEAVFGSPDFPRTSGEFNARFQIEQADLWITDDGQLAIHLPGDATGGGLDASLFGPDTPLIAGVSFLEEQDGTAGGSFEEFTLGEITTGLDWPAPGWTEIEPDREPLRLNVPDTSNRN